MNLGALSVFCLGDALASLRIKVPINEISIPEPTSVLGTLIVEGFGIVLKRRKDIRSKRMFAKS